MTNFKQALQEALKIDNKNVQAELDNLSEETVTGVLTKVLHEIDMIEEGEHDVMGTNKRSQNAYLKHAKAFVAKWAPVSEQEIEEKIEANKQAKEIEEAPELVEQSQYGEYDEQPIVFASDVRPVAHIEKVGRKNIEYKHTIEYKKGSLTRKSKKTYSHAVVIYNEEDKTLKYITYTTQEERARKEYDSYRMIYRNEEKCEVLLVEFPEVAK